MLFFGRLVSFHLFLFLNLIYWSSFFLLYYLNWGSLRLFCSFLLNFSHNFLFLLFWLSSRHYLLLYFLGPWLVGHTFILIDQFSLNRLFYRWCSCNFFWFLYFALHRFLLKVTLIVLFRIVNFVLTLCWLSLKSLIRLLNDFLGDHTRLCTLHRIFLRWCAQFLSCGDVF